MVILIYSCTEIWRNNSSHMYRIRSSDCVLVSSDLDRQTYSAFKYCHCFFFNSVIDSHFCQQITIVKFILPSLEMQSYIRFFMKYIFFQETFQPVISLDIQYSMKLPQGQCKQLLYSDMTLSIKASQITDITTVCSTTWSSEQQRKYQSQFAGPMWGESTSDSRGPSQ